MKQPYLILCGVLLIGMLTLPLLAVNTPDEALPQPDPTKGTSAPDKPAGPSFKVLVDGKVLTLPEQDYLCGVLAHEMPAQYEPEALKAQAVAAYTLACRERAIKEKNPDPALKDADFSGDPNRFQGYLSPKQQQEKYGDKAEEYRQKIKQAVEAVAGEVLVYEGEPVLAAYHAISSGKTESAQNVWGDGPAYLQPVLSVGDLLSPDYQSENVFTSEQLKKALAGHKITFGKDPAVWFGEPERTDSGMVRNQTVCGVELTGMQLRTALGLRSANFDVDYADEQFTFVVRGYGHDVGMSQNGANYMAGQGFTYEQILSWYYPGCTLTKI